MPILSDYITSADIERFFGVTVTNDKANFNAISIKFIDERVINLIPSNCVQLFFNKYGRFVLWLSRELDLEEMLNNYMNKINDEPTRLKITHEIKSKIDAYNQTHVLSVLDEFKRILGLKY